MALDVAQPGPAVMHIKLEGNAARWVKLAQELNIQPLD